MKLKYTRRKKRTIGGKTYDISPPNNVRSKTMSNIPKKATSIEKLLAKSLRKNKIKYRSGQRVFGKPDFILLKYKVAIFCDGDFWHGYSFKKGKIKTNSDFWDAKIMRNMQRDKEVNIELQKRGWKVLRFWEHEIKKDTDFCIEKIKQNIA